jgi:hypothetical protein
MAGQIQIDLHDIERVGEVELTLQVPQDLFGIHEFQEIFRSFYMK